MPRDASITAEMVCLFRALELQHPSATRVLEDHYAPALLRASWRKQLENPWVRAFFNTHDKGLLGALGHGLDALMKGVSGSGLQHYVVLRHRHIDELIARFMAEGGEQLVLLGTGYDMRPYRLSEHLRHTSAFEVDFPATLEAREARLSTFPWLSRDHIHAVPIDFMSQGLKEVLERHPAYSSKRRTFFVWEGVAMYLDESSVRANLQAIQMLSPEGSELAFDLWGRSSALTPRGLMTRISQRTLSALGEPLRFLLPRSEIASFCESEGLEVLEIADGPTLSAHYSTRKGRAFPDFCVVHTRVRASKA